MFKRKLILVAAAAFILCAWPRAVMADNAAPINKALTAFYAKNFDTAYSDFQNILQQDPRCAFALVMWLECANRLNKMAPTVALLEAEVAKTPSDPNLQSQLGLAYMYLSSSKMSAVTAGQEAFNKALAQDPNCSLAHAALGIYYYTDGKAAKAKNQLTKAKEVNPGDLMAGERLGEITLIDDEKPELSMPAFKTLTAALPQYADGFFFLGMAQEKSNKLKDAIASYQRSIQLDPNALTRSVYSRVRVARLYQDSHHRDLAVQVLQDLIKMRPDFKDAQKELTDIQNGK